MLISDRFVHRILYKLQSGAIPSCSSVYAGDDAQRHLQGIGSTNPLPIKVFVLRLLRIAQEWRPEMQNNQRNRAISFSVARYGGHKCDLASGTLALAPVDKVRRTFL